ncbi:MAG: sigma-54-dependent transcriptional regulator [Desulfatiglandales bacterium]
METILIIDDDDQLRLSFEKILGQEGYRVIQAPSGEGGIKAVEEFEVDLVLLDIRLPGKSGMEVFEIIHEMDPKLPVIIMTAYGTTDMAIEAIKKGAFEYIFKPFDVPHMLETVKNGLKARRIMQKRVAIEEGADALVEEALIGKSRQMQEVYKTIARVAPTDATVLIRGESGTGKELVARAIYQYSNRSHRPFSVINCVAIPETLLESELFGYEKGAFTGAIHRKIGKIEGANSGTIFLDEIGDMPSSIQAKVLRLLEEKSIERLGGKNPIQVDVRIIAATNRDLEKAMRERRFREDLYYRLNVVTIWLPPLRDRRSDIPLLLKYYLERASKEMGVPAPELGDSAIQYMMEYDWPGNVRELVNTVQKILIFQKGLPIEVSDIQKILEDRASGTGTSLETEEHIRTWARELLKRRMDNLYEDCMEQFSMLLISEALRICKGNKSQAAKLLGLSRPTLHAKIDKFKLTTTVDVH